MGSYFYGSRRKTGWFSINILLNFRHDLLTMNIRKQFI